MLKFLKSLQFIFRPSFWVISLAYNKGWDKRLNKLLDDKCDVKMNNRTAILRSESDEIEIWVSNYPYAFGYWYQQNNLRPSRLTIERLATYIAENGK